MTTAQMIAEIEQAFIKGKEEGQAKIAAIELVSHLGANDSDKVARSSDIKLLRGEISSLASLVRVAIGIVTVNFGLTGILIAEALGR